MWVIFSLLKARTSAHEEVNSEVQLELTEQKTLITFTSFIKHFKRFRFWFEFLK